MANEKDFEKRMTFIESMLNLVAISINHFDSSVQKARPFYSSYMCKMV